MMVPEEAQTNGPVPAIEFSGVTKTFGETTAVDDVSFCVRPGETFVLLGTSGCGKTTTLRIINRLIEPTRGAVRIAGSDAADANPETLRRDIGYVIQDIGLFPHYTTAKNIAVVPELLGWDSERIRARSRELLHLVGLDPEVFADRYPHELSGGQQQRVGLARALAADPAIVLMDEPFGALDPLTRREIQREFKRLEALLKKTTVLVTHDVFEACDLGDRICLLDRGRVQQIGPARELLFDPANDFVHRFFRSNRFLLELKVYTLQDVLPHLPKRTPADDDPVFSHRESLLDVLETLERDGARTGRLTILGDDDVPVTRTGAGEILSAFFEVKPGVRP
jgi:osmoprotectant transport system ATP-binding protein